MASKGEPFHIEESDIRVFAKGGQRAIALDRKLRFKRIKPDKLDIDRVRKSRPISISIGEMKSILRSRKLSDRVATRIEKVKRKVINKRPSRKKSPTDLRLSED